MGKSRAFVAALATGMSAGLPAARPGAVLGLGQSSAAPAAVQQQLVRRRWRLVRQRPALRRPAPGTRGAGRLFARARARAEEARSHHLDRGHGRRQGRLAGLRARRCLLREARDRHRAQASHQFRPHPLRRAPRRRVAADGARDHRGREAEIHRHDDRQQRPSDDPRKGARRCAVARPGAPKAAAPPAQPGAPAAAAPAAPAPPADPEQQPAEQPAAAELPANLTPEQARAGQLRPVGIPHGEVGTRLYQAHRRHHRRAQERGRSGASGSVCRRSAAPRPAPIRPISTSSTAAAPRRPASSMSTSGTASSTRPAATRRKGRTTKARSAACAPATASISPSSARASWRTMSSARSSAPSSTAACRLRCRCRSIPARRRRAAPSRAAPAQRPSAGPVLPLTAVRAAPEELIGTARPAPAVDTTATRVLTKGEPIAAPSGRADDFSWPRGNVTLEPATADPAATPDSAARTAKPAERAPGAPRPRPRRRPKRSRPPPRRPRPRPRPIPGISSARSLASVVVAAAGSDNADRSGYADRGPAQQVLDGRARLIADLRRACQARG